MTTGPSLDRLLARRRWQARLALWWEAAWPAAWPAVGVAGLALVVALAGVPMWLPPLWHLLLLAGFAGAFGYALWRGVRHFRLPGAAEAERRLEVQSGLRHRPIATLADRPTGDDPWALALWQAHRDRAATQIRRIRVGAPRPGLARLDRRALRGALAVALVAAVVAAGAEAPERLRRAVTPAFALPPAPAALRLEAWVTPPAYTGAPPVFLSPQGGAVTVPQGSRLQLALSGGLGGTPELLMDGRATEFRTLDRGSYAAEAVLAEGGRLAIRRDGAEIAQWSLTVQADAPPVVAFTEPPARAQRGLGLRLPWRVEDDWGAVALRAELRLVARPQAAPHVIELPLPAASVKQARGAAQPDLSAHPWAGLEVEIRLVARDGAGQEGQAEPATATIPERSFNHPVARALIGLRKALSVDPTAREPARRELDAIAGAPEAFEHDTATYLALRAARHRLLRDRRGEAIGEVQEILWEVALALEEGRTDRTLRALAAAREALREALDRADRNEQQRREAEQQRQAEEQRQGEQRQGETPEQQAQRQQEQAERQQELNQERAELQRRIQELREAIQRHLEALAERLQRENAEAMPFDPQQRLMDQRDVDRRTRRMEEAAREGRNEDARRELAELEEMLKALEEGRVGRAENPERQRQRERGQQQMGAVQDMVRRQGEMLDRGHQRSEAEEQRRQQQRRLPQQRSWGQPPPQAQPQPADPQAQAEQQRDGRQQRALRRALGELMQQYGDLTGEVPEPLGRADQAMREAQEALGEGRDARQAQQRAIEALQEGGRQMAQQMQRQFGQGQGQEGEEEGEGQDMAGDQQQGGQGQDQAQQQGPGRDPLGRRTREAPGASDTGSDTRVPDEAELLRSRRIQEELRRRGAERERPPQELDYIDRLLKRF